ncbi:MAG: ubiquinone biosynthesis regulatory protein kinase UbiB [Gammaproteobacteria bacterium]|nr:ubiquinone biosynthesis regulatory protein kinase UbiB [Gammaproteobacteria bacterium]
MRLLRIARILRVSLRHRVDLLLPDNLNLPLWARILMKPLMLLPRPKASEGVCLRLTFEELGPVFVKFGQILSTRKDLFSDDMSLELEKLQEQVPPFDSRIAIEIIEQSIGEKIPAVFSSFSETPLASASVAQVHLATLHSGEEVVVKVIRPGVEKTIKQDLDIMFFLAKLVEQIWRDGKRLHPVEIVKDYEQTILNELNLQLEASNTTRLSQLWEHTDKLYVPEIYWDYTSQNVMVMERIHGVRASDIETLKANKVNLRKLSHLGVEIFFTQVFVDNFFHADMHPGNVFVDISDPENPNYIALDCAIIGSLTETDKDYLAKNLIAFFNQDYHEVARLHVASGWVPKGTDVFEFEAVIRAVCEPIFQKPIKDISFGKLIVSLFQTARQFDMEVQPQLVLLQKTLLNVEGLGRQIYDELDLWETAAPLMERWMSQRVGFRAILKSISEKAPHWLNQLPEVPDLAFSALTELKDLGDNTRQQTNTLLRLEQEITRQSRQNRYQRIGGFALIAAIFSTMIPLSGYASGNEMLLGTSILGSLGVYWMYIHA